MTGPLAGAGAGAESAGPAGMGRSKAAASLVGGAGAAALWCAVVGSLLFLIVAGLVLSGRLTAIDTRGILFVRTYASSTATVLMLAASRVAHGVIVTLLAVLAALLIFRLQSHRQGVFYAVACLSGEVLHLTLKAIVRRHRPVGISPKLTDAGWYSFPSGHTMLAVVIFGLAAWLLAGRAGRAGRIVALALAAVLVAAVGLSRVYLGAHWPSDVIGAALAGLAWSAGWVWWIERTSARGGARTPPA